MPACFASLLYLFPFFLYAVLASFQSPLRRRLFSVWGLACESEEGLSDNGECEARRRARGERGLNRKHNRTRSCLTVGVSVVCSPGLFVVLLSSCCLAVLLPGQTVVCPPAGHLAFLHKQLSVVLRSVRPALSKAHPFSLWEYHVALDPTSLFSSSFFFLFKFCAVHPTPRNAACACPLGPSQANRRQCHYLTGNAEEEGEAENGERKVLQLA